MLRRTFLHLLRPAPAREAGVIEVRRRHGGYVGESPRGRHRSRALYVTTRWVQYQVIAMLIAARPDLIWLHGAVAGLGGRGIVLPGRRGRGKSLLVSRLWARGCTFLTDDILPLDPVTRRVLPFPVLPAVRRDPGKELSYDQLAGVAKTQLLLEERIERDPLSLGAIVLPFARRDGATRLAEVTPGEAVLALLEGCWNLPTLGGAAVAHLARIVPTLPLRRLDFADPDVAAKLAVEWAEGAIGATV